MHNRFLQLAYATSFMICSQTIVLQMSTSNIYFTENAWLHAWLHLEPGNKMHERMRQIYKLLRPPLICTSCLVIRHWLTTYTGLVFLQTCCSSACLYTTDFSFKGINSIFHSVWLQFSRFCPPRESCLTPVSPESCPLVQAFLAECPGRVFLGHAQTQLKTGLQTQERHLFLFTDTLLVAKAK